MNFQTVCSEIPSILIPSLLTKRANFLSCLAGQAALVQWRVLVPLSLSRTTAGAWQTGHSAGMTKLPTTSVILITFGIILLALMTCSLVPLSPMPRRSHSLTLQSEARCTVVPSSSTGLKTATGVMVLAAHDHSMWSSSVSACSSCHLKANPALVAWWPVTDPVAA